MTGTGRRAAFLDRDGTLIEDAHYLADADAVRLLPGAAAAVRELNAAGVLAIVITNQSGIALGRITPLLLGIVTRTTYLELLTEFPGALKHLIRLCADSPMIAGQLARYPLLLDELLDPNTLYQPTATNAYRDELRQYLLRVPEDDEEQQLEAMRQFKQAQLLRAGPAQLRL